MVISARIFLCVRLDDELECNARLKILPESVQVLRVEKMETMDGKQECLWRADSEQLSGPFGSAPMG